MFKLAEGFEIGTKKIGKDAPCYIIAEAGSNHNRDLKLALQLIDIAVEANADAVKFQTFTAETIASQADTDLSKINFGSAKSLFELYKNLELPRAWQNELFNYAKEKGIMFLSTPFDEKAVDELFEIGVCAFKIASFELNHFPLLRHVARTGKPVLLSTGMATLAEIEEALLVLNDAGCNKIGLFHCGINYPMNPAEVNLRAMNIMRVAFGCPVGYSDHTLGIEVPIAVAAREGKLLEKHFTFDRELPGPDHRFALDPEELKTMVSGVRTVENALGVAWKGPTDSELVHKRRGCRSLHAKVDIAMGVEIREEMITILRPAAGLHPRYLFVVSGRKPKRDICAGEPITWECI